MYVWRSVAIKKNMWQKAHKETKKSGMSSSSLDIRNKRGRRRYKEEDWRERE